MVARRRLLKCTARDNDELPPPPLPRRDDKPPPPPAEPSLKVYLFGDTGEFASDMKKVGIDPTRFILFNLLAVALALGANFVGVTSNLMTSTNPTFFRELKVDRLYQIAGYFRHVDDDDGYEFLYPQTWMADQTVMLANAKERELPLALRERQRARLGRVAPNAAYGPMAGDGRDNVSVIKSSVMDGFTLAGTLGTPKEAAERLLANVIAAPGSGKTATLIDAYADERDGQPAYVFEYTVQKGEQFYQHSVSVIMSRGNALYTLTAVSPEASWPQQGATVKEIAASFRLKNPTTNPLLVF